jgi:hypothetical protein
MNIAQTFAAEGADESSTGDDSSGGGISAVLDHQAAKKLSKHLVHMVSTNPFTVVICATRSLNSTSLSIVKALSGDDAEGGKADFAYRSSRKNNRSKAYANRHQAHSVRGEKSNRKLTCNAIAIFRIEKVMLGVRE